MAAKRIKQVSINWAAFAERVPENQKSNYIAFKAKSDGYLRRMMAYPEEPPKIDWNYYKTRVAVKGLVDDFQKKYDGLKIPYPIDTATAQIEAQEKQVAKEIQEFIKESNARIVNYEAEVARLRAMVPYEEMTMEDFKDAHPELALDPLNKPTYWPHNPEEQLDYEEESESTEKDH